MSAEEDCLLFAGERKVGNVATALLELHLA